MPDIEKLIASLERARGLVVLADIERVLNKYGYSYARMRGSHIHFQKEDSVEIRFAVHNGKVKSWYARDVIKKLRRSI